MAKAGGGERLSRCAAALAALLLCAVTAASCAPAGSPPPPVGSGEPPASRAAAFPKDPPGCRRTLVGVAHPDDDLFFVNPEIERTVRAGCALTTVYLTAGDDGERNPLEARNYARNRANGVRKAYAEMAGAADRWTPADVVTGGRVVQSFTLAGRKPGAEVRLTFMRLHDGMPKGGQKDSMLRLFTGDRREISLFQRGEGYDEKELLTTLTSLIRLSGARRVLTLDHDNASFAFGLDGRVDHADHGIGARYLRKAAYRAGVEPRAYLAYTMTPLAVNLTPSQQAAKERIARWYDAERQCPRERVCVDESLYTKPLPHDHAAWVLRQYEQRHRDPRPGEIMGDIGRTTAFTGRNPEQCLGVRGSAPPSWSVGIAGCDGTGAQRWGFGGDGSIRPRAHGAYCLTAVRTGVLLLRCEASRADQKWRRLPWPDGSWKRSAWRIAGTGDRCLHQEDRTFPRWNQDRYRSPRPGLTPCGTVPDPELYWRIGG
ncbi:PIG-L family deacetylase [Streptomyces amakusaensis]|uniref:Ricin-type beta-trefoil lectin domain protein n=1 Tax=Streptomyces amakusaensis TaxID=67271 RepID=A0ABW0AUM5_9ACTN